MPWFTSYAGKWAKQDTAPQKSSESSFQKKILVTGLAMEF